jgi:hypothetical protein
MKTSILLLVLLASCSDESALPGNASDASVTDESWVPLPDGEVQDRGPQWDPFGPFDRITPDGPPPRDTGNPPVSGDSSLPEGSMVLPDASIEDVGSGPRSTESIFERQSPDCLACAQDNACFDSSQVGGVCEMVEGRASKGGRTEKELCLDVLAKIFTSHCADGMILTPCLCGTADPGRCLSGLETPNGPLYEDYLDEWPSGGVGHIVNNFTDQAYGAGMANAAVQCAMAYGCNSCFGIAPDGGAD